MRVLKACVGLAACALAALPTGAMAKQLAVASVSPQGVACIFTPKCAVTATDTVHFFQLFGNGGNGRLLIRTYPGLAGTRAAGLTGYSMFIDMHGATALGTPNCVDKLIVDAGPVESVNYAGPPAEVFVVSASAGSGIASATQTGSKITFTFAKPICPNPGRMTESLYFGFAAKGAPVTGAADISADLHGVTTVKIRVPKH